MKVTLLTVKDVAAQFNVGPKTVRNYARKHDENASASKNPYLPSSPTIGLHSLPTSRSASGRTRRGFDPRDVGEYLENGTRELLGLPLRNWRAQ
jgi:hypothetical protein